MIRPFILVSVLTALFATSSQAQTQMAPPSKKPAPTLARWVDVQNLTVTLRYRFVDTSAGIVTTNQLQHREAFRGRLKFDQPGRYALNLGAFSGSRFTSSWNNTGIGMGDWQKTLGVRNLYFAAQPVTGLEVQYGSLYIIKGESSEITTYDEDGYVIGERVSVRRPRQLFFDEMSATVAYLTSSAAEYGVSKRVKYLDDHPNYWHFLVDKKAGPRLGVSADFTSDRGAHTWRAATNVTARELRLVDTMQIETYKRTNNTPDYGFAVSLNKALHRQVGVNWGYARIDPLYGGLNADRFNIGKRVFFMSNFTISPRLTASAFITTAIGDNVSLPQRTLLNLLFTYNALPDLRRTGWF